ncbi:MAG: TonB-dependent receptor plug domain-containing protein [Bacteroidetes bacterium]|nr:TonB-dependent receptor plug domain-containing protein [Bacteroidota bacterium]MBL7104081.1 TonB-dependent receptor plug domain-containing protein [Bacteroidales bacterium]
MKKIFILLLFTINIAFLFAQTEDTLFIQTKDSLLMKASKEYIPQITVFATELEDDDIDQGISGLLQSSHDIFVSTAGYVFGQTRFKIRGYSSENTSVLINGIPLNDMETGRAYWSSWGGLNDAVRNKEIETGIASSKYTFGGIGGVTNMVTRASSFSKGVKFTYSATNRSYRNRLMFLASTGLMDNGWAFTFSGSRRWAQEGYVEGTFYDAWSYFISAEKKINKSHSIGLIAFGAPNKRGKNGVSVQEAYDLAGTNYYNPYWGYQNGEKRNARINNYHQPMFILSHYWTMNEKTTLTSSVYYSFGRGGGTALDWYDVADPRPDYYKNLPSDDREYLGYTSQERLDLWQNDKNFRQIDWDHFYFVNRKNLYTIEDVDGVEGKTHTGNLSNYIVEDRHYDKSHLGANINLNKELTENVTILGGLNLSWYKGFKFKVVDDLLGGDFYLNVDKYAERDFSDPITAQNDLNHPNQVIKEGDKFGYDYTGNINKYNLFVQGDFSYGKVDFFVGGELSFDQFWRTGLMRNGKFPDNSYGDSEKQSFTNYGLKGGAIYKITGRHFVDANAMYLTRAPFFRTAYISPRTRNQVIDNLTNEKIMAGDISYIFRSPYIKARATLYYTKFVGQIYARSYYHDVLRSFVNYQMTGVDKVHYGVEAGIEGKVSQNFTLFGVLATGEYYYDSRPTATISVDNNAMVLSNRTVYLKNYKVGGFPQTAVSAGVKYFSSKYIFAGFNINFYDNIYIDINPDRRTAEAVANYAPDYPYRETVLEQERFKSNFTIDAYIGKSWRIDYKYYISVNFSVNNILDNQDFAFGGFEQYRYDPFDMDKFPPKYFYLYGRQYYFNVNFRF